jgi:outer membrane protein assembly factor BamB
VIATLVLITGGVLPAPARASDPATATPAGRTNWSMPRFDPQGTGFNPYERRISPANVASLKLAWSALGSGPMTSTPIVVDGVVYASGQVDATGTAELYAYEAKTGKVIWTRTDGGQPLIGFTVADGKIYAGFLSAHIMRVYETATGDLLWSVPGPNLTPTVVDGVVYAPDNFSRLWAIDAETGRKRWVAHVPFGGYGFGVAVANGMVYAGGDDVDHTAPLYAYDAKTGALVWRHSTGGQIIGTPAVANGTVYVGSNKFYAFDALTGRTRWTASTGGIDAPAAVADGVVYVGSTDKNLYAFDAETGKQLWVAPTGGTITAAQAVAVANGVVYVGNGNFTEYAFDATTGDQLWSYSTGSPIVHEQSVVDGTLYFTSTDAYLYAFRLPAPQSQG